MQVFVKHFDSYGNSADLQLHHRSLAMGRRRTPTVLVGRSALLREGVARILEGSDLRIDQSVASVAELRTESLGRQDAPLLVIECGDQIDLNVGEIERFKLSHPHGRVAALGEDYSGEALISLFEAGTNVLLGKSTSREIFLRALELVVLGETLPPRELLAYLRPGNPQQPESSDPLDDLAEEDVADGAPGLSARERSILCCLVAGEANKVIARRIGIAESTVKVHVKTILRKIRAQNRTQAAIWAMNNKIGGADPEVAMVAKTSLIPEPGDQNARGKDGGPDDTVESLVLPETAAAGTANGSRH